MKEHLKRIAVAEKTAVEATAKIAKVLAEQAKYQDAASAARQQAEAKRSEAHRLLALAAVGEIPDTEAAKVLAEADRLDMRVGTLAATLRGLADSAAAAQAQRDEARAEQLRAGRDALTAHAETVCTEYRGACIAYIEAIRRVHAVEELAKRIGAPAYLLRVNRDLELPALVAQDEGNPSLVGGYDDSWYSYVGDQVSGKQAAATAAERERLAELGLRL